MAFHKLLSDYPEMLNAKMIAEILQVGYTKALNLIKYHLPYMKFGNTYRVHKGHLESLLKSSHSKEFLLDK
jgi:hypothetical protein